MCFLEALHNTSQVKFQSTNINDSNTDQRGKQRIFWCGNFGKFWCRNAQFLQVFRGFHKIFTAGNKWYIRVCYVIGNSKHFTFLTTSQHVNMGFIKLNVK